MALKTFNFETREGKMKVIYVDKIINVSIDKLNGSYSISVTIDNGSTYTYVNTYTSMGDALTFSNTNLT
jgi:hypothetical protein